MSLTSYFQAPVSSSSAVASSSAHSPQKPAEFSIKGIWKDGALKALVQSQCLDNPVSWIFRSSLLKKMLFETSMCYGGYSSLEEALDRNLRCSAPFLRVSVRRGWSI